MIGEIYLRQKRKLMRAGLRGTAVWSCVEIEILIFSAIAIVRVPEVNLKRVDK